MYRTSDERALLPTKRERIIVAGKRALSRVKLNGAKGIPWYGKNCYFTLAVGGSIVLPIVSRLGLKF